MKGNDKGAHFVSDGIRSWEIDTFTNRIVTKGGIVRNLGQDAINNGRVDDNRGRSLISRKPSFFSSRETRFLRRCGIDKYAACPDNEALSRVYRGQ